MATPSQSSVAAADSFAIARELLLEGAGLELAVLDRALSTAMERKLDYVDLYLQLTRYETWTVEDGIVK
jgi:TldD protein